MTTLAMRALTTTALDDERLALTPRKKLQTACRRPASLAAHTRAVELSRDSRATRVRSAAAVTPPLQYR